MDDREKVIVDLSEDRVDLCWTFLMGLSSCLRMTAEL